MSSGHGFQFRRAFAACKHTSEILAEKHRFNLSLARTDSQNGNDTPERSAAEKRSEELVRPTAELAPPFDPFTAPPKRTRFEILLDAVMHPRRRKHHASPGQRPKPTAKKPHTLFPNLTEAWEHIVGAFTNPEPPKRERTSPSAGNPLVPITLGATDTVLSPLAIPVVLSSMAVADGVEYLRSRPAVKAAEEARSAARERRRKYYAAESQKRQEEHARLAAAAPQPENACPTPEILLDAYAHRHDGEAEALHFGRLMIDLEEYHHRLISHGDGHISGSSGGIRAWLALNCPELFRHYHTCQRFKRRAQDDPVLPEEA